VSFNLSFYLPLSFLSLLFLPHHLKFTKNMSHLEKRAAVCDPLPDAVYADIKPAPNSESTTIATFFDEHVNNSDKKEAPNEFKKTLVLETQRSRRSRPAKQPRVSKKQLTARERRDLGVNRLPKIGLKYSQFKELNSLWQEYMNGLLDIPSLVASRWKPDDLEDPRLQQLRMKVYRADLHGAFIKVESALAASHVGVCGICLLETKHTLQIISSDNKLRMMPKKGSTFCVEVGSFKFSFPGSGLLSKPAERATKKPKCKMPLDF